MKLLNVKNAAQILGIHPETLRKRIRDGSFPAVNISHGSRPTYRISEKILEDYENTRLTRKEEQARSR